MRPREQGLVSTALTRWIALSITTLGVTHAGFARQSAPPQANLTSPDVDSPPIDVARLGFIENLGQFDDPVRFVVKRAGLTVALTSDGFCIAVPRVISAGDFTKGRAIELPCIDYSWIRFRFEGAAPVTPEGRGRESAYANFFLGNDPTRWRSRVPSWAGVHYEGLYPGIDLDVRHTPDFEYDLNLAPGADLSQVRVRVEGARRLSVDTEGTLCIETVTGVLRQLAPRSFVLSNSGTPTPIHSRASLLDPERFGFDVPERDPALAVTIDPPLQTFAPKWFTYWGTHEADVLLDVVRTGGAANPNRVVATGGTLGVDLLAKNPISVGYAGDVNHGDWDVVISEFDSNSKPASTTQNPLARLVWTSYIGGTAQVGSDLDAEENIDVGRGVDVDSAGNVFVAGYTYDELQRDFPTTAITPPNGMGDAFALKVSGDGSTLVYSRLLSSTEPDCAEDVKVDSDGNAYVTGWTTGVNEVPVGYVAFPTTSGVWDSSVDGRHIAGFLCKINPNGSSLIWSTALEPTYPQHDPNMRCFAVSLDTVSESPLVVHPFVTGDIETLGGGGLPTTATAFQPTGQSGQRDAFLLGVDENASQLTYSSYLGGPGNGESWGWNLVILPENRIAIVGATTAVTFPLKSPFRTSTGALPEAFVAIFDPTQPLSVDTLEFSSFLGGAGIEEGLAIDSDAAGSLYVTGYTTSVAATMTDTNGAPLITEAAPFDVRHGPQDAFLFKITNHAVIRGALIGGDGGEEIGYGISFNGNTLFIGGTTTSSDFHSVLGVSAWPQSGKLPSVGTSGSLPYIDWVPPNLHALPAGLDGFVLRIDSQ